MPRHRVRAQARRQRDEAAQMIGNGVYIVARDLARNYEADTPLIRHVPLQLPKPIVAPLVYVTEMAAVAVAKKHGLDRARTDELALYLLQGTQEALVALIQGFDEEHFEAWVAAAQMRDLG